MKQRYLAAQTYEQFVATAEANRELWGAIHQRARLEPEAVERLRAIPGQWHLLVLNEDWCGDAVNTVPLVARLAEAAPNVDLRILGRDANPDLIDAHLTNGSRSIPVVILLDEDYRERGWWGPRPSELQRWVLGEGMQLDKTERYRLVRQWYARDRGRTTVDEILTLLERAALPAPAAPADVG